MRYRLTTALMLSLSGFVPGTVWAQEAAPQQSQPESFFELAPIIIRGELQGREIQDSPTSVAVATGEQLERRGDKDLLDFIERAPNVSTSLGQKGFQIRGVDQRGPTGAGIGLVISTQVDGVAMPDNQATFFAPLSTWDIEQIEVLRGPQSTQQGRNALAGAIVVRSKDPTYDLEAKLRGELGSRATRSGALMVNTPLIEDKLAFRFSAESYRTDGTVKNPTLGVDDYDAREMTTYRAKLRFDPTDDIETILSYTYNDHSGGEDFVQSALFPDQRVNLSNVPGEEGTKSHNAGLRVNWDINDRFRLESETTYYKDEYYRLEDIDQTPADEGALSVDGKAEVFEQDLRLRFDQDRFTGVVGMFYTNYETNRPNALDAPLAALVPSFGALPRSIIVTRTSENDTKVENFAIFGETDIDAGDMLPGLSFTLGARYDRERVKTRITDDRDVNTPIEEFAPPFLVPVFEEFLADRESRTDNTFDAFLPKLGATYEWTSDVSTSFTVQRGYRAGGAQQNLFTGEVNEFDPEFTWNYELALRAQFLDGLLTTNANVFYTDWRDQQVSVTGDTGDRFDVNVVNAGNSRLYGGELMIEAAPMAQLDLFASAGYTKTEFLDFDNGTDDLSGNEFPLAPEFTAAFGGTYRFDNGISISADASYTGSSFSDAENTAVEKSDDRFLVNAQVNYERNGWLAGLYVRNLFDVDYATSRYDNNSTDLRDDLLRAGEPLTLGAFAQYAF